MKQSTSTLLTTLLFISFIIFISFTVHQKNYQFLQGWKDGYIDGHHFRYQEPIDSIPKAPQCSDSCTYTNGYKLGIHRGFEDVTKKL